MSGIAILLLIVIVCLFVGPYVMQWLKRKAMERAEDYVRQAMGLPPVNKKKKKKDRKNQQQQQQQYYNKRQSRQTHDDGPLIPKEYAEDVEFVEVKNYSHTEKRIQQDGNTTVYHESQISDVEWTEIKKPRSK